jgi:hypothetical protein
MLSVAAWRWVNGFIKLLAGSNLQAYNWTSMSVNLVNSHAWWEYAFSLWNSGHASNLIDSEWQFTSYRLYPPNHRMPTKLIPRHLLCVIQWLINTQVCSFMPNTGDRIIGCRWSRLPRVAGYCSYRRHGIIRGKPGSMRTANKHVDCII